MIKIYQKTVKDTNLKKLDKFKTSSWVNAKNPNNKSLEKPIYQ